MAIDIVIYESDGNNHCSIKGISDDFGGRMTLSRFLYRFQEASRYMLIYCASINYYVNELMEKVKQQGISNLITNLEIEHNVLISFQLDSGTELPEQIVTTLADLWFGFEHSSFYFFKSKEELRKHTPTILNYGLSWQRVSELPNAFLFYKGIEEDVVWIGKSKDIPFPSIVTDYPFN